MSAPPQPAAWPDGRPDVHRRDAYRPRARVEQFIVPLLARAIGERLAQCVAGPGSTALDVGCGGQPFRAQIERTGYRYVSMDTQKADGVVVDFIGAIDALLPERLLAAGGFQLVLCTEVLEHVADWDAAFENFSRVLAPSGRVLITCPQVYPPHEEPYDFWRPTDHAVRFYAARHGLTVVELTRLGDGWDVLGTVLAAFSPKPDGVLWAVPAFLARLSRKLAFLLVKVRLLRSGIRDSGSLYLSTLAVLEKP